MIIFWKCLENEFGIEYAASASCFALEREAVHSFYPDIAPWPELHARRQLSWTALSSDPFTK